MNLPERPSRQREGAKLDALFITRLERLIRMRHDYRDDLNPLGLRLLDRAIYATYRDCVDYGAGKRAKTLIAGLPSMADEEL